MNREELIKRLSGYDGDHPVYIEVEDDSYVEIVSVGNVSGGPFRTTKAIILQISDPLDEETG